MEMYSGEPMLRVGIMERKDVEFSLTRRFLIPAGVDDSVGMRAVRNGDNIVCGGISAPLFRFIPMDNDAFFELKRVTIGVNFHWEREEAQRFRGSLVLEADPTDPEKILVINEIGIEEYLKSVISSEMSAHASGALLKAHAVMSRSWVLRQIHSEQGSAKFEADTVRTVTIDGEEVKEYIRWYDRDNHKYYDVCADDHCQRYQGITRQTTPVVAEAVEQTRGMVLMYGGEVADARFHKCCGGVTELFENCWEPVNHPYLRRIEDHGEGETVDFCADPSDEVLRQVLNDYDRESRDFYSWTEVYAPGELERLIETKAGVSVGEIVELRPLERGASGRIIRLLIRGTQRSVIVGKELEIRRWLSKSHLRSSWFDAERQSDGGWCLNGRGWGHGAGLCQIGAAVMGERGYDFKAILNHYFPGTEISKVY